MFAFRSVRFVLMLLLSAVLACAPAAGLSQGGGSTRAQQATATSFVEGVANVLYTLAWPTATYQSWSLNAVNPVIGGLDVVVTLDGLSGIDRSDLWCQLKLELRRDGLHDVSVLRHNAFWVPPFETTKNTLKIAAAVQQEMAAQEARETAMVAQARAAQAQTAQAQAAQAQAAQAQAAQAQAAQAQADAARARVQTPVVTQVSGVCLTNSTATAIAFQYRTGGSQWEQVTLETGKRVSLSAPYTGSALPPLTVRYGVTLGTAAGGTADHAYTLGQAVSAAPLVCENTARYEFTPDEGDIVVLRVSN